MTVKDMIEKLCKCDENAVVVADQNAIFWLAVTRLDENEAGARGGNLLPKLENSDYEGPIQAIVVIS